MDTPDHKLPQQGISQKPMPDDSQASKARLDESGALLPTDDNDLSLEHRQQLQEDQRHNRDGDLEYQQGGDASDENGDPTFEEARDLEKRARLSGVTEEFVPVRGASEDEDLERERLKTNTTT